MGTISQAWVWEPLPALHSNHLRATVSLLPRGNIPQVTVPLPPPITMQKMHDMKQVMQTQGHMNHKMSHKLPVGQCLLAVQKSRILMFATFIGGANRNA